MRKTPGWRRLFRLRSTPDAEVREELEFHVRGRIAEYVAQGFTEEEARRKVEERFGERDEVLRECRRLEETVHKKEWRLELFRSVAQDVRLALRGLRRSPMFAITVLLTLGLSIGGTTAIFSVVNGLLLRPLPYPESDRLVNIWMVDQRPGFFEDHNFVTVADFADWQDLNNSFEELAAYQAFPILYRDGENSSRVLINLVTEHYLSLLRVEPVLGRGFMSEEFQAGNDNVVMISHDFWQRRLGGDSTVIGQTLQIGSAVVEVVGVLPPGYEFQDRDVEVVSPRVFGEDMYSNRKSHIIQVFGRLKPGVTIEMAQADMERILATLTLEYPENLTGWSVNVVGMAEDIVGDTRPVVWVMFGAVALLLAIAVVNVANLTLSRLQAGERSLAVRRALGAGNKRVFAQVLTENVVTAVFGGLVGVVVGEVGLNYLLSLAPETLPHIDEVSFDARVLAFAAGVSVLAGILVGVVPALHGIRRDVTEGLREGSRTVAGTGTETYRNGLVVAQVAISLVLLIASGLMVSSLRHLLQVDTGFETGGVLTFNVSLARNDYPNVEEQSRFLEAAVERIGSAPGASTVGVTRFLPLRDVEWTWSVDIEGEPEPEEGEKRDYGLHPIVGDYLQAAGIGLVAGRYFNDFDDADGNPVMIVNESFVDRFFPGDRALGRRIHFGADDFPFREIVGVVEDTRHYSLSQDPLPAYYIPFQQVPYPWFADQMTFVVKSNGDPLALMPRMRAIIHDLDSRAPVTDIATLRAMVDHSVARTKFTMMLLLAFAVVAMTLAAIGVYGVISYTVSRQTREIGIRMALGAEPRSITRSFVLRAGALAGIGLVVGIGGAVTLTRLQRSMLFGVDPVDPAVYATVVVILGLVSLTACYLPAWRASRLDPSTILREE